MGQPITVVRQPSSNPEVVRFEINRSLTGMGHERYKASPDPLANRPVDELARRIFDHGGVAAVHVNSSVITVDLAKGSGGDGIEDVIRSLFLFYPPAATAADAVTTDVPVDDDATVADQAAAVAAAGASDKDVAEEAGDAAVPQVAADEQAKREETPGTSSAVADAPGDAPADAAAE